MPFFSGRCYSKVKLTGKTAIITGCHTGIGIETALDFYKRGARVIMACQSVEQAQEAKNNMEEQCQGLNDTGHLVIERCDLSSLQSVREFTKKILDTEPQINILVNNAEVLMSPESKTKDGFEMHFGANHLAHFLLTLLLLPRIRNSTPARIVTVSSLVHMSGDINFDDLNYKKRPYVSGRAYAQSKLANVIFSRALAEKLKKNNIKGIKTYSLHPGVIRTELIKHIYESVYIGIEILINILLWPFAKSTKLGAQTSIYCAVDEKCADETGLYYSDCVVGISSPKALKDEYAKKLWKISTELVGLVKFNPFGAQDPGVACNN